MNTEHTLMSVLRVSLLSPLLILTACAGNPTLDDSRISDNSDPYESTNRSVYDFNDGLDVHLVKPLATGYEWITPTPVRTGVGNFFDNIGYINVIVNSSLQGKLDQGISDLFRFLVNSTLGVVGIFDVATPMGLEAHNEDLGQTLAVWGSGQGAYLTLPFLGSSSSRDVPDIVSRTLLNPLTYAATPISLSALALDIINTRANLLDATDLRDQAALDPYTFTREAYLQQRRRLIYDGDPPQDDFDALFESELGEP